ncbi:MAG: hypothetical protein AAFP78_05245 [Pseudomonadota bacterium]
MRRLLGYLIAGGFTAIAFAGYRWFSGEVGAALIAAGGVVMIALGFWLSGRYGEDDE